MFLLRLEDVDMAEAENRDSARWLLGRCRGEACQGSLILVREVPVWAIMSSRAPVTVTVTC
jgi:hypothetical protein